MPSSGALSAQAHCIGRSVSDPYSFGFGKRLALCWKYMGFPKRVRFKGVYLRRREAKILVVADSTLAPEPLARIVVGYDNYQTIDLDDDFSTTSVPYDIIGEDSAELDRKERLRRLRISKANKGSTPWNKGRKHSTETIQRIRERTKIAMQSPQVKMKLKNLGHKQSDETKTKIGEGVQLAWRRRHHWLRQQEACLYEWHNLIAETSRRGLVDEGEFRWNSYKILDEQLEQQWLESVRQRKLLSRPKGSKRKPKSLEQRRKIAEAIAAKWEDPEYRERVYTGMSKHYGAPVGATRKLRRKNYDKQSGRIKLSKDRADDREIASRTDSNGKVQQLKVAKSNKPRYNDPLACSKLEMIKNIRAQRASSEKKAIEAVERARLLIAQAENAANSLELAAMTSPRAHLSLVEARKSIAEAIKLVESCDNQFVQPPTEHTGTEILSCFPSNNEDQVPVAAMDKDFDLGNFALQNVLKKRGVFLSPSSKATQLTLTNSDRKMFSAPYDNQVALNRCAEFKDYSAMIESRTTGSGMENGVTSRIVKMKKWVRGKFVEVRETE